MSKVSLVKCTDYDREKVFEAVKRSLDTLGGMGQFVKADSRVLIKPNLLSARCPEDGVDTHPEVVRAVVKLVKGMGGRPVIGDSPGGYMKNIDEVYKKSGMKAMADEEGVEMVKFSASRFIDGIPISRYVFDCDTFISVPKFKTHCITVLTAAIKNTYGVIVGLYKAECHSKAPKEEDFAKVVAKVHSIAKPHLTVVDGIVAMEGDGPSSGVLRNMNLIASGTDSVAIDACLAVTMGLSPCDIRVTKEASLMGLGEADLSRIEITGDSLDTFIVPDFKMPQTIPLKFLPKSVANTVAAIINFKPYIDELTCARCNLCKVTCPVHAIDITKEKCVIDYKKCVRCMCCHEVCPYKAIGIKRNILTKLIWG